MTSGDDVGVDAGREQTGAQECGMTRSVPTTSDYLARIGLSEPPGTDLSALTTLQQAHLSHIPFENIDVFRQTGVSTDLAWSLDKVVTRHRGGWCFENNGAFGWLLRSLGFTVTYLGAYVLLDVADPDNMSHMCLRVDLDQSYLVDVGFGDSFTNPIPLVGDESGNSGERPYRLEHDDVWITLIEETDPPQPQYRFTLTARTLPEFTQQSDRLQTPGTSHFTEKPFVTRSLGTGTDRVTLLTDRIKFRRDGVSTEESVDASDWNEAARQWFGFELD
jgi:N-hydroxyarylamine O-acetyltransferase